MTIDSTFFKTQIKRLEAAFNFTCPQVRIEAIYAAVKGHTNNHIHSAITYLINNKPYFPINADIIIAVRMEAEKDWASKKDKERQQAKDFFDPDKKNTKLGKDAINCIMKVIDAETCDEKVALMMDMEKKYPGIGYKQEAEVLKRTLTAKSHNL